MGKGFVLLAALLAGCATPPEVLSKNARMVVIRAPDGLNDATLQAAERECALQGLHARLATGSKQTAEYVFDCVR